MPVTRHCTFSATLLKKVGPSPFASAVKMDLTYSAETIISVIESEQSDSCCGGADILEVGWAKIAVLGVIGGNFGSDHFIRQI
jgi:hypothetical protein